MQMCTASYIGINHLYIHKRTKTLSHEKLLNNKYHNTWFILQMILPSFKNWIGVFIQTSDVTDILLIAVYKPNLRATNFYIWRLIYTVNSWIESRTLFRILRFGPGLYSSQDTIKFWKKKIICFIRNSMNYGDFYLVSLTFFKHVRRERGIGDLSPPNTTVSIERAIFLLY